MRVAFITNLAPHYRRPLYERLARRHEVDYFFFSMEGEWYFNSNLRHQHGDFNTPPDSAMFREYWSSYGNAFSTAGFGWGYTHFTRRTAVRIDQILYSRGWQCKRCWVGPNVGSEHRPVIADVEWIGLGE